MNTTRNLNTSAPRKSWLQAAIVATVAMLLVTPMIPSASAGLEDTGCFAVQATNADGGQVGTFHGPGCGPIAEGGGSVVVPPVVPTPTPIEKVCTPVYGTISWASSYTRTDARSGNGSFLDLRGDRINYTVAVTSGPRVEAPATSNNLSLNGGRLVLGSRSTELAASRDFDAAYTQTATITFDKPVENLTSRVFGIDGSDSQREHVAASGLPSLSAIIGTDIALDEASNTYRPMTDRSASATAATNSVFFGSQGSTSSVTIELTTPRTSAVAANVMNSEVRLADLGYHYCAEDLD